MPLIGHAQIRNRGTVGGSLAHADPGAELPRWPWRWAAVRVGGPAGERVVPAAEFFLSFFTTALEAEIVTSVEFPSPVVVRDGRSWRWRVGKATSRWPVSSSG